MRSALEFLKKNVTAEPWAKLCKEESEQGVETVRAEK